MEAFAHWVQGIVRDLGYPGLFVLIFLESTLVPIPSTLVMPFAGFMASQGTFSLPGIILLNSVAALMGSGVSYAVGRMGGKPLILKYGKYLFIRPKDLEKTEAFFAKPGRFPVFIGRFLPVVRHVISIPAGIAKMPLRSFFIQTFLGSTIWGTFLILVGYYLGANWESFAKSFKRVDLILGSLIIVIVVILAVRFLLKRRRERRLAQARELTPTVEQPGPTSATNDAD